MPRYICIYYTANSLSRVNRKNKKVVVIDTDDPKVKLSVEGELKLNHNAKYIRYIRSLDSSNIHFNDTKLKTTEEKNNQRLKQLEDEKTRENSNISKSG